MSKEQPTQPERLVCNRCGSVFEKFPGYEPDHDCIKVAHELIAALQSKCDDLADRIIQLEMRHGG